MGRSLGLLKTLSSLCEKKFQELSSRIFFFYINSTLGDILNSQKNSSRTFLRTFPLQDSLRGDYKRNQCRSSERFWAIKGSIQEFVLFRSGWERFFMEHYKINFSLWEARNYAAQQEWPGFEQTTLRSVSQNHSGIQMEVCGMFRVKCLNGLAQCWYESFINR